MHIITIAVLAASAPHFPRIAPVSTSELVLLSDSMSSENWADYGISLLVNGESHAEDAFSRSLELADDNQTALCGLAARHAFHGEYSRALRLLNGAECSLWSSILSASVLQRMGRSNDAEDILLSLGDDTLVNTIACFLSAPRQSCSPEEAARHLAGFWRDVFNSAPSMDSLASADILLYGGYFSDNVVLYYTEMGDVLCLSRALWMYDRRSDAINVLSSDTTFRMDVEMWKADMLLKTDRLAEAMSSIDRVIEHCVTPDAVELKGLILLKAGRYEEAFNLVRNSGIDDVNRSGFAVMGLAAEMATEYQLAIESYAGLLGSEPDSIVLINRLRRFVLDTTLEDAEGQSFQIGRANRFNGGFSISYSDQKGDLAQHSLSASTYLDYKYGLYGSRLSIFGSYNNFRWPGPGNLYESRSIAVTGRNASSSTVYQRAKLEWEDTRSTYNRNSLEASIGVGSNWDITRTFTVRPFAGFGRVSNWWDEADRSSGDYALLAEFGLSWDCSAITKILPSLSLSSNLTQYLDEDQSWEGGVTLGFNYSISQQVSLYGSRSLSRLVVPSESIDEHLSKTSLSFMVTTSF